MVWTVRPLRVLEEPRPRVALILVLTEHGAVDCHVPATFGRHILAVLLRPDDESEDRVKRIKEKSSFQNTSD